MKKLSTKKPVKSGKAAKLRLLRQSIYNELPYFIREFIRLCQGKVSHKELWSLDNTLCEWFVPRLKQFKVETISYPPNLKNIKAWYKILDEFIWLFGTHLSNNWDQDLKKITKKETNRAEKAWELLQQYFNHLWL